MSRTRRQFMLALFGGTVASLVGGCQTPTPTLAPTATNPLVKPRATGAELTAVLANGELARGRNRFALGLIDARNQAVTSGNVNLEFFKLLPNGQAQKRSESVAVFRSVGGASRGIWVTPASYPETGQWGAQVTVDAGPATPPKVARMDFQVLPKFSAPGYDEPAPRSASPTERDVSDDTSRICSNSPPCAMHTVSVSRALEAGDKALVVLFATPALCTTTTCAPELQIVDELRKSYADRANFIHVEIYQYPFDGLRTVGTVDEWHLATDPWTFIVDKAGIVRDRFEGPAPFEELEPSLKAVLG